MHVAESIKPLYVKALKFGKEHISSETGFYHYSFENKKSRDTIPFFENLCVVLALLRSHQTELMLEGRELLSRLLPFQNKEGGFPYYLHQYPFSYHPAYALRSTLALYKIFQIYGRVLGSELATKVKTALHLATFYIQGLKLQRSTEYLQHSLLHVLKERAEAPSSYEIQKSEEIADVFFANDLLERVTLVPWHSKVQQYAGPLYEEKMKEYRSMETLIDLFVGKEVEANSPLHLYPALLDDPQINLYFPLIPSPWKNIDKEDYFLSYLSQYKKKDPFSTGFHLLRLCTKEHTLVLQQKNCDFAAIEREDGIDCIVTYNNEPFDDDKGDLECSLFINHQPKIGFLVKGEKANLLYPEEEATLLIDNLSFSFTFYIQEGEGNIVAHFARGNRPSQVSEKVKQEWEAFDWQIAFRTLSRSEKFSIKISIDFPKPLF